MTSWLSWMMEWLRRLAIKFKRTGHSPFQSFLIHLFSSLAQFSWKPVCSQWCETPSNKKQIKTILAKFYCQKNYGNYFLVQMNSVDDGCSGITTIWKCTIYKTLKMIKRSVQNKCYVSNLRNIAYVMKIKEIASSQLWQWQNMQTSIAGWFKSQWPNFITM